MEVRGTGRGMEGAAGPVEAMGGRRSIRLVIVPDINLAIVLGIIQDGLRGVRMRCRMDMVLGWGL